MLDVKMIVQEPEVVKERLKTRLKDDEAKQNLEDDIDVICWLHHEIKATKQAIENARHLQRQLEQDMQKLLRAEKAAKANT